MNTIPIALLGSGAMGKELLLHSEPYFLPVVSVFDITIPFKTENFKNDFAVAIDFTLPHLVLDHIKIAAKNGVNLVIGTTGWSEHLDEIKEIVENSNIGVIYGSNFSIGMQMTFKTVRELASLINLVDDYDIAVHEYHHTNKVDSPSGTATSLAKILLESIERKTTIESNAIQGKIDPTVLHCSSTRLSSVVGKHIVTADSSFDTIEISHNAKTRTGFALGALRSARWINGRRGFYNFEDVFEEVLQNVE